MGYREHREDRAWKEAEDRAFKTRPIPRKTLVRIDGEMVERKPLAKCRTPS